MNPPGASGPGAGGPGGTEPAPQVPWYADGLQFTCTRCGNCCTGAPGFTWVDDDEIARLADRLGLDNASFRRRYTRRVHRDGRVRISLTDKANHDCVFWQRGAGCTVYADRPRQCRTWPFWTRLVDSPASWADAAHDCPGMNRGERHDAATIAASAANDGVDTPTT